MALHEKCRCVYSYAALKPKAEASSKCHHLSPSLRQKEKRPFHFTKLSSKRRQTTTEKQVFREDLPRCRKYQLVSTFFMIALSRHRLCLLTKYNWLPASLISFGLRAQIPSVYNFVLLNSQPKSILVLQNTKKTISEVMLFPAGLTLLLLGAAGVQCMYSSNSDVVDLTPNNFDKKVIDSDSIWIVEFYAPWCGHCQSLKPEYEKAATALKV